MNFAFVMWIFIEVHQDVEIFVRQPGGDAFTSDMAENFGRCNSQSEDFSFLRRVIGLSTRTVAVGLQPKVPRFTTTLPLPH